MNKTFKTILITVIVCILLLLLGIGFIGSKAGVSTLPFSNKLPHGVNWGYGIVSENSNIADLLFVQDNKVGAINYRLYSGWNNVLIPKSEKVNITLSVCKETLFSNIGSDCEIKKYTNPICLKFMFNKQVSDKSDTMQNCDVVDIAQSPWKRIYYTIDY